MKNANNVNGYTPRPLLAFDFRFQYQQRILFDFKLQTSKTDVLEQTVLIKTVLKIRSGIIKFYLID